MYLRSKFAVCCAGGALLLASCARQAPPLPPDYETNREAYLSLPESVRNLSCEQIVVEDKNLKAAVLRLVRKIHDNRARNQAAGYIGGVIFPPALLALENDDPTKLQLDRNQARRDQLILAEKLKKCAVPQ